MPDPFPRLLPLPCVPVQSLGSRAFLAGMGIVAGLALLGGTIALPAAVGLMAAWQCVCERYRCASAVAVVPARRPAQANGRNPTVLGGHRA